MELVILCSNRQSVAPPPPPYTLRSPSCSSPNVCQQTPALVLAHCVGRWCLKSNSEMKIETRFWDAEDLQIDRGSVGWLWMCVQRTSSSSMPDTPSWISATPSQMCRRLVGWGEGGEGVPRGLYSLVTAKRLPLPEGRHGNTIWFLQQCQTTTPPSSSYSELQAYTHIYTHLHTFTHTHPNKACVTGRLRWGSWQSGRCSWFKRD